MRTFAGLLLVSAAILKVIDAQLSPAAALAAPLYGWASLPLIGVEFCFGLVVLSGVFWNQVRWLLAIVFVTLSIYSLHLVTLPRRMLRRRLSPLKNWILRTPSV